MSTQNLSVAKQLDLFSNLQRAYADGPISNEDLYAKLVAKGSVTREELDERKPIDRTGIAHSCAKRKIRWYQQTLKKLGVLEGAGQRGKWRLTESAARELTPTAPKTVLLGFSTRLGVALWAYSEDVFVQLDAPITLCLTSPPYPLAQPRAYGNPSESEYVDWLCAQLEPIVKHLVPGGSIVLNVSNDIFLSKSPARSLYRERLVLALHERLGLFKMDELIWHNPCKAPGPIAWASKQRVQLNVGWEPVYWFTNDPLRVQSNNRRVLEPHSDKHASFVRSGGSKAARSNGDGSQRIKVGAFSRPTEGRIPRNLLTIPHNCPDQAAYRRHCAARGLAYHGASMPLALAKKIVEFITPPEGLVVDLFGGSLTTAKAAEELGRPWMVTDKMREYVIGGASRFVHAEGYEEYF